MLNLPETVDICSSELKFPNTGILSVIGPTFCGKSTAIIDIILDRENTFLNAPNSLMVVYRYWQPIYDRLKEGRFGDNAAVFIQNWRPNIMDELSQRNCQSSSPMILLLDDVGEQLVADRNALSLFSGGVHHYNLFLIYVTQFLFLNNEVQRQALRQSQYIMCFPNIKHRAGLRALSKQIFDSSTFLQEAIQDRGPYEYILVDLRPYLLQECLRCRSGPYNPSAEMFVYLPSIKRQR